MEIMDIILRIESWIYPLVYLLLIIVCLTQIRNQGGKYFAFGFGLHIIMSLAYQFSNIFDLYSKYDKIYVLLGHINFIVYIIFTGLFIKGISVVKKSSTPTKEVITDSQYPEQNLTLSQILFSFNGRINRAKFWAYILPLNIFWITGAIIDFSIMDNLGPFYFIGVLISFWPGLALNVKRCHDRNKSGWFYLVAFIPFVNLWYTIEIGFVKGTDGDNRFGPDPLRQANVAPQMQSAVNDQR